MLANNLSFFPLNVRVREAFLSNTSIFTPQISLSLCWASIICCLMGLKLLLSRFYTSFLYILFSDLGLRHSALELKQFLLGGKHSLQGLRVSRQSGKVPAPSAKVSLQGAEVPSLGLSLCAPRGKVPALGLTLPTLGLELPAQELEALKRGLKYCGRRGESAYCRAMKNS